MGLKRGLDTPIFPQICTWEDLCINTVLKQLRIKLGSTFLAMCKHSNLLTNLMRSKRKSHLQQSQSVIIENQENIGSKTFKHSATTCLEPKLVLLEPQLCQVNISTKLVQCGRLQARLKRTQQSLPLGAPEGTLTKKL